MMRHLARPHPETVARSGLVATGYTAACCLGVSGAVSLASSVGATALTRDATLQPLLVVALAITIGGCAWTYWRRHRRPAPLLLSVAAGAVVYAALFGPLSSESHTGGGHGLTAHHGDAGHHTEADAGHHTEATVTSAAPTGAHGDAGTSLLVWTGLLALFGAQVWELYHLRSCRLALRRGRHAARAGLQR